MRDCAACGSPTAILYSHMGESGHCLACFTDRWHIKPGPMDVAKHESVLNLTEEDEGPTSQPEDPEPRLDDEGGF